MDEHTATEQAYKNGYEKGYEDGQTSGVIRCEECRWFTPYRTDKYSKGDCNHVCGLCKSVSPTDFCSCGERMDHDDDT